MKVKSFPVGWLSTNCYVVSCEETREAAVIDPGMETEGKTEQILDYIKQNGFKVKYIINTHGHDDHTSGNYAIKEATGAPILIHKNTLERVDADRKLQDGDVLQVGNFKLTVLHTPGHTPGGISLLADNAVFAGDTLQFVGRTAAPMALICVGGGMALTSMEGRYRSATFSSILKVFATPLFAYLISLPFNLSETETLILMIFSATPTAVASYVMAKQLHGDGAMASGGIIISTLLSMISLSIVVSLF